MSLDFLKSPVFMRVCAGCANGNEATEDPGPENTGHDGEDAGQRAVVRAGGLGEGHNVVVDQGLHKQRSPSGGQGGAENAEHYGDKGPFIILCHIAEYPL